MSDDDFMCDSDEDYDLEYRLVVSLPLNESYNITPLPIRKYIFCSPVHIIRYSTLHSIFALKVGHRLVTNLLLYFTIITL